MDTFAVIGSAAACASKTGLAQTEGRVYADTLRLNVDADADAELAAACREKYEEHNPAAGGHGVRVIA